MMYPCTKLYHWATYYYQVIDKNIKEQVYLPEAVCCCLQTCNSCIVMYMMGLMLGQSLVVTGVIVIVLHVKTSPYYNVWHKVISY